MSKNSDFKFGRLMMRSLMVVMPRYIRFYTRHARRTNVCTTADDNKIY